MSDIAESEELLERYLKARIPLITVRTDERKRALDVIRKVATKLQLNISCHTNSRGMYDVVTEQVVRDGHSYYDALDCIKETLSYRDMMTFALTQTCDLSTENDQSREFYDVVQTASEKNTSIIVVSDKDLWPQLQRTGLIINLDRPNEEEAARIIRDFVDQYRGQVDIEWDEDDILEAASALAGVSAIEIENTIASLVVRGYIDRADLEGIRGSKDRLFSDISGLEKIDLNGFDDTVGGLEGLQGWCDEKRVLMTPEKRDDLLSMGLKPPRGILLVGVPGCGKSLSAKAIASNWKLPLYRLDFATVQGSYVGQSERQLKEAFSMAEAVSPCVLWIDEIEKGLGGAGAGDSTGVSTRMVGQFLFWLQECSKLVFVVATANDVSKLPSELLRRGRFDEIFFVDLPSEEERREILSMYATRYFKQLLPLDVMDQLVRLTDGFSGADIESSMRELGYFSVLRPHEPITTEKMLKVFGNVVPLSQTAPEQIESIQEWGRERAVPASGRPIGGAKLPRHEEVRSREVLLDGVRKENGHASDVDRG